MGEVVPGVSGGDWVNAIGLGREDDLSKVFRGSLWQMQLELPCQ